MCLWGVCGKGDEICPLGNSAGRVVLQGKLSVSCFMFHVSDMSFYNINWEQFFK